MAVYLVTLTEPNETALENIRKEWPDNHYQIDNRLIMVATKKDGVATADSVMQRVGIEVGQETPNGLVLLMTRKTAAGVLRASDVNWYQAALEKNE